MERGPDSEGGDVFKKRLFVDLGEIGEWASGFSGVADGFVVDISEVHHAEDMVSPGFEVALEQILKEIGAEVADVGVVVDGGTAGVHADRASLRIEGGKHFRAA
jgi:hypothetical protein